MPRRCALCGGANTSAPAPTSRAPFGYTTDDLYAAAVRIFRTHTPVVAAVQGAAIGGGLGLALSADFRIAAPEARFSANFARLGFHHGFGLSVTLPRLVGQQTAADLLFTGRRVKGDEAVELGLADRLADLDDRYATRHTISLARSPSRHRSPSGRSGRRCAATWPTGSRPPLQHEAAEQERLRRTADFVEGNAAMSDRRQPNFTGE